MIKANKIINSYLLPFILIGVFSANKCPVIFFIYKKLLIFTTDTFLL